MCESGPHMMPLADTIGLLVYLDLSVNKIFIINRFGIDKISHPEVKTIPGQELNFLRK
jgi:hypothetical protein